MTAAAPRSSESWHRVARLRVRVARDARAVPQRFRGDAWWVVQEPWTRAHVRVHDTAWRFLVRLDGNTSVEEAYEATRDAAGDPALDRAEVVELLGWLHHSSLLEGELPPDAAAMFARARKRDRDRITSRVLNPLFFRVRLFDPDALLERALPWGRWFYSKRGGLLWLAWVALGVATAAASAAAFVAEGRETLSGGPLTWVAIYAAFLVVKAVHETSHGLALKTFAEDEGTHAEVREIGLVGLGLVPSPYVDASDAWLLRSKWRRAGVALAGIYAELAIAAGAALLWSATGRGALHALAYHLMLVAGVGTLVFNGNPLVRLDGYYALSDLIEIPNLWGRSRAAVNHLLRARLLGIRDGVDPARDPRERLWLVGFALVSGVYRVLICVALVLFLGEWGGGAGIALALLAVTSWFLWPAARSAAALYRDAAAAPAPRVARVGAALALAIGVAAFVPLPDHERAEGIVEPARMAYVYLADEGVLERVLPSGSRVQPDGAALAISRNHDLEAQRDSLDAELQLVRLDRARADVADPALAQALGEKERVVRDETRRVRERIGRLEVRAPFAGRWVAPDVERLTGAFVRPDPQTPLGVVASDDGIVVRVVADQTLGPRLAAELGEGASASVRLRDRPDLHFDGVIERIVSGGQSQLPSASLGTAGGGQLATNPRDPKGLRPDERFFEVRVRPLDGEAPALLTGQRAVVRFTLAPRPAFAQLWTVARQLVQRRLRI